MEGELNDYFPKRCTDKKRLRRSDRLGRVDVATGWRLEATDSGKCRDPVARGLTSEAMSTAPYRLAERDPVVGRQSLADERKTRTKIIF